MTAATVAPPRRVFCVLEHEHRDLATADEVCAGVFRHGGHALALGTRPDWRGAALPADPEWRIEWVKFYVGLDLAHAFACTGNTRYAGTWFDLLTSWLEQTDPGTDKPEIAARRVQNWLYAWNRFAQVQPWTERWPAGLDARLLERIAQEAAHIRRTLSAERNHRTLELYALFIVALALPELDIEGVTLAWTIEALAENLRLDIRPDGVQREHSTHYHCLVLRTFVGVLANARLHGLALPHDFEDALARACDFALHAHRPDGVIPALSDSDSVDYRDTLRTAGELLGRADWVWSATGGERGAPPHVRHASFLRAGYHVQRSGWGHDAASCRDQRFLIFDCGAIGDGGHGHYDVLSLEASAGAGPIVVDPGRYTYAEHGDTNWRRWFKGTSAHNTVTVDGLDQVAYRRGRPKGPTVETRLLGRGTAADLDVIDGLVRSPCYDTTHRRTVVFVADEYWLVIDALQGTSARHLDLRWHLAPGLERSLQIEDGPAGATVTTDAGLLLLAHTGAVLQEPGWYAGSYGAKVPTAIVSCGVRAAAATFVTAIVPRCASAVADPAPARASGPAGHRVALHVHHLGEGVVEATVSGVGDGRSRDHLRWDPAPASERTPGMLTASTCHLERRDNDGICRLTATLHLTPGHWERRAATDQCLERGGPVPHAH